MYSKSLKLVDQLTYLGRNFSSPEADVNLGKAWTSIDNRSCKNLISLLWRWSYVGGMLSVRCDWEIFFKRSTLSWVSEVEKNRLGLVCGSEEIVFFPALIFFYFWVLFTEMNGPSYNFIPSTVPDHGTNLKLSLVTDAFANDNHVFEPFTDLCIYDWIGVQNCEV